MGLAGTVETKVGNGSSFQQPWYYAIGEERVSLHGYCTLTLKINVSSSCHVRRKFSTTCPCCRTNMDALSLIRRALFLTQT